MTDAVRSVVPLLLLIARSKLIPDFALTIHAIHLVVTSVYSKAVPRHYFWWALQVASAGIMVSLGMWSCQWRELQPIQFAGLLEGARRDVLGGAPSANAPADVERGGAGEFEMTASAVK